MGKRSKPNSAKNVSTSEKAVAAIGLNNDLETFEKREAIKPIDDTHGKRLQSEQGTTVHGVDKPGNNGPHATQAWLPGSGPGKRGVRTEAGTRENLAAAPGLGIDPSQAQAVHDNINSGRTFDDRKLMAPADRSGDSSRRPAL
jgi:hypothetical protein